MERTEKAVGGQFLSFVLRDEYFAVEIFKVREVLDVAHLTSIPRMPDYLCGVINLRGRVVPVVDLGLRLGMAPIAKSIHTCIIIVEVKMEDGSDSVEMGVLTDKVQAVMELSQEDIEPVPAMGANIEIDFIKGMGRQEDKFMILLDLNRILTSEEQSVLRGLKNGPMCLDAPQDTAAVAMGCGA